MSSDEESEKDDLVHQITSKMVSDNVTAQELLDSFRLIGEHMTRHLNDAAASLLDSDLKLFSLILPQVRTLYSRCVHESAGRGTVDPSNSDESSWFTMLMAIFDCLDASISRVCSSASHRTVEVGTTCHLIETVLETVLNTFRLYNDCDLGKCERILEQHLNKAISLTKAFVNMWDKLKVNINFEHEVQIVLKVCDYLCDICQAFESICGKPAVSLWKCYTCTLLKYCDEIKDRVDVAKMIQCLCKQIATNLEDANKHDAEDVVKSVQLCGFFCKILKTVCDKFKYYLGNCFSALMQLILMLYRYTVPSHGNVECRTASAEIEKQVTIVVEPLTIQLMNETCFLDILKDPEFETKQMLPKFLLLLLVMENLPNLDDQSQDFLLATDGKAKNDPRSKTSVLNQLFKTFARCTSSYELALPVTLKGIMCGGKPVKLVSLYEYACTKLCAAVTVLPSRHFPHLEETLLYNLTCGTNLWQSMLACDVWAYLGRLESPKLCYQHLCILALVVDRLDAFFATDCNDSAFCVRLLCRRLFRFLPAEYKMAFVVDLPYNRHPGLWCCILPSLPDELFDKHVVAQNVVALEESIKGGLDLCPSIEVLKGMYCSLRFLSGALTTGTGLPDHLKGQLLKSVLALWSAIDVEVCGSSRHVDSVVCASIRLLAQLASKNSSILMQVLPKMVRFQRAGGDAVQLSVSEFTRRLAKLRVPASVDQREIFRMFVQLLCGSGTYDRPLTNNIGDALVLHHGLESFSSFAHETPHGSIVPQCFVNNPNFKALVVDFLKQVPVRPVSNCDYESLIRNQLEVQRDHEDVSIGSPLKKRAKHDNTEEKLYEEAIDGISKNVAKLLSLLQSETKCPKWLPSKIDVILAEIQKARSTIT